MIENIIGRLKPGVSALFCRTAQRAEADVLLEQGAKRIGTEHILLGLLKEGEDATRELFTRARRRRSRQASFIS